MTLAPSPAPLRVYFDLAGEEHWHRRDLETRLAVSRTSPDAVLATDAQQADCILQTTSPYFFGLGGKVFRRVATDADGASPPRFVWSANDQPTGRMAGLYCSLPRPLFDPRRHRTFCYPFRYNECVDACDLREVRHLFGFVGGITSGLRHRLLQFLSSQDRSDEAFVRVQSGPWGQMFDRTGVPAKADYAEALRRCRFFLCPRGNGVSSIRLFETMQAARVPVIISDEFVPPAGIAWERCSVRVKERDLGTLPAVLRERVDDWPALATEARRVWETHFSDPALLGEVGRNLRELMEGNTAEGWSFHTRVAAQAGRLAARRVLGNLRDRLRAATNKTV